MLVLLTWAIPAGAQSATAQSTIGEAAAALRSDPVYVDRDAELALSEAEAEALRERIEQSGAAPMYLAVLPADAAREAGGSGTRRSCSSPGRPGAGARTPSWREAGWVRATRTYAA